MTSTVDSTTTSQKGGGCFRDDGISSKRLCKQVSDKITADVMQVLLAKALDPAAAARSGGSAARACPAAPTAEGFDNVQLAFRLQEYNKSGGDKCDTCKAHFDVVLDTCDAVVFNVSEYPTIPVDQIPLFNGLVRDALRPSVYTCTKSFPVACCCGGACGSGGKGGSGGSGVDYVEYGITICYQVAEFPLVAPGFTSFYLYYAVDVKRLSGQQYRNIDGKNCAPTPGLEGWSSSGVVELFPGQTPVVPITDEDKDEEEEHVHDYDFHTPSCKKHCEKKSKCADHDKHGCHECKPKKIDPCDCHFPARKITYKPLGRFRLRTDEPAWVCGVPCKCPMQKNGNDSNCKERCCTCKYVCISASGQRASSNIPDDIIA